MKYIVKKSWFAAKEGEILEAINLDRAAYREESNGTETQVIHSGSVGDALDQGFIEPYEEKPKKIKQSGVLTLEQVDQRIDGILCEYITCDDCGGYGIDHDRSTDSCNYCAMYEKVDDAKAKILEVLSVNESFGIRCSNNVHLLSIQPCKQCKKDNKVLADNEVSNE